MTQALSEKRPLPTAWIHRTPSRTWFGPLKALRAGERPPSETGPWLRRTWHVLGVLTRYDFRGRYRAQALGVLWSLLNPLVMMSIISLVFTHVFRTTTPNFPVFVLLGLIVWQWVTSSLAAGTQSFVANAELIKRTLFHREVLPVAAVLSYGINFCLEAAVVLLFIPIFPDAFRLSPALALVPLMIALFVLLLIGITLATSVLNVIYRDVAYIVNTAVAILYWLTPVFYPTEAIPYPYRHIFDWNPVGAILTGLRGAVMRGETPSPLLWLMMVLPTLLVLVAGWWIFQRFERMALDHV